MGEQGYQKLEVEVRSEGFEEAAKKSEQLDDAQKKLTERMEDAGESFEDTGKKLEKLSDTSKGVRRVFDEVADFARRTSEPVWSLGGHISSLALGVGKLVLALKATSVVWRALPAAGAIVQGILSIVSVLKQEVAERLRLVEVMRTQARLQDELLQKQLTQQQTLEQIAGRRRGGGFTADASRKAQVGAERAQKQFGDLRAENINLAFGTFGDLGFTQRELVGLAILAQQGELRDLDDRWSDDTHRAYGEAMLRRGEGKRAIFEERETRQGVGMGAPEYATGQPTERAQRVFMETMTAELTGAPLRERLAKLLPPEMDIDQAVKLIKLFGTPQELEKSRVKKWSARPLTALLNAMRIRQIHEIALPDQPGFKAQATGKFEATAVFEQMGFAEYDALLSAFEQIQKEGRPGAGFDRTPATTQPPVVINQYDNRVDNRGAWQTFADPVAQRNAQRGSDFIIDRAER